jgi:tellurite resistance protein
MTGYALLQALILLRLLAWIRRQAFVPGYWGFAFGATALATATLRLAESGADEGARVLAGVIFGAANIVIGAVIFGTLRLAWQGRLLPRPMPVASPGADRRAHAPQLCKA